jgi:hypothetical protein
MKKKIPKNKYPKLIYNRDVYDEDGKPMPNNIQIGDYDFDMEDEK